MRSVKNSLIRQLRSRCALTTRSMRLYTDNGIRNNGIQDRRIEEGTGPGGPPRPPECTRIDERRTSWQTHAFQVIELVDPAEPSLPRFVGAQQQGQSVWRITWQHRDALPGKLPAWFRELSAQGREPIERVLLGRGVGLTEKTAFALTKFRISEICRMATGDPSQMADFLVP